MAQSPSDSATRASRSRPQLPVREGATTELTSPVRHREHHPGRSKTSSILRQLTASDQALMTASLRPTERQGAPPRAARRPRRHVLRSRCPGSSARGPATECGRGRHRCRAPRRRSRLAHRSDPMPGSPASSGSATSRMASMFSGRVELTRTPWSVSHRRCTVAPSAEAAWWRGQRPPVGGGPKSARRQAMVSPAW